MYREGRRVVNRTCFSHHRPLTYRVFFFSTLPDKEEDDTTHEPPLRRLRRLRRRGRGLFRRRLLAELADRRPPVPGQSAGKVGRDRAEVEGSPRHDGGPVPTHPGREGLGDHGRQLSLSVPKRDRHRAQEHGL